MVSIVTNVQQVDYDEVVNRITSIYNSCSLDEKIAFKTILQEISEKGYSQTLEQVWLKDFVEIPVSIDRFITESDYLGETNRNGEMVYPFWRNALREIFTEESKYSSIVFSGATRIGKTSTAITCMAYMLYRLMIYRDPHSYFKKKSISKFTIGFANLTKDLAKGVGFREFQDTLRLSEWFNQRGKFTRSERDFYYVPDGGGIEIIPASDAAHLLGKQLWACLTGDTKIITNEGVATLQSLCGRSVSVKQLNINNCTCEYSKADIVKTEDVYDIVEVQLEDGSVIKGTPDHPVLLWNGTYKQLGCLDESDDVFTWTSEYTQLVSTISTIVDVTGCGLWKRYPGHNNVYVCSTGKYIVGLKDSSVPYSRNRVYKYHKKSGYYYSSFGAVHRVVAETFIGTLKYFLETQINHKDGNKTNNDVSNLEIVTPYENMQHYYWAKCFHESRHDRGNKISKSRKGVKFTEQHKQNLSNSLKGKFTGSKNSFYGKHHTDKTKKLLSDINSGKHHTEEEKRRISQSLKNNKNKKTSKGKIWVNNGVKSTTIDRHELPKYLQQGWTQGRIYNGKSTSGMIWINDGTTNTLVTKEKYQSMDKTIWHTGHTFSRKGVKNGKSKQNN